MFFWVYEGTKQFHCGKKWFKKFKVTWIKNVQICRKGLRYGDVREGFFFFKIFQFCAPAITSCAPAMTYKFVHQLSQIVHQLWHINLCTSFHIQICAPAMTYKFVHQLSQIVHQLWHINLCTSFHIQTLAANAIGPTLWHATKKNRESIMLFARNCRGLKITKCMKYQQFNKS